MIMDLARKDLCRKYIAGLVCLFLLGNSVHGTVLCFGADGHIEFESAFHKQCSSCADSESSEQIRFSCEAEHEEAKHCGPCVDVPISIGLAKISQAPEQLNPLLAFLVTDVVVAADEFDFFAHNLSSNTFADTSYFTPLRTIILLA
jgi:hypothetical protein